MRSCLFGAGGCLRHPMRGLAVAMAACLLAAIGTVSPGASPARASTTAAGGGLPAAALFPKFSTPKTLYVADTTGFSGEDLLTALTLQGVYNGEQHSSRLYLIQSAEDKSLLSLVPSGISQVTIPTPSSGTLLQALLRRFGPYIRGAIVTDPSNVDTVNLATTLAGIDHAVVINPDQESLAASLGIPVVYNFDTAAFTADTQVQTYEWAIQNLLPKATTKLQFQIAGTNDGWDRDYAVATRSFVYYLTTVDADEVPLLTTVLHHDPVNTPILGYVPNENQDVAYESQLGYFLNGTQTTSNESVWAAMPSPASLRQKTEAAPLAAKPGTVYAGLVVSDGDNIDYDEQTLPVVWANENTGSVPEGWSISPATISLDPDLLEYFYKNVPADSELLTGPSGIGYTSQEHGADMTQFGALTQQLDSALDIHTVDTYQPVDTLAQYSGASGGPEFVSKNAPLLYTKAGNTAMYGETSWYVNSFQPLFCTIAQQTETERPGNAPLFLQPMINGYVFSPSQVLTIAQSIAAEAEAKGLNIVFTTPTELGLTMERYYSHQEAGLPAANAQSMTGAQVLAEQQPASLLQINNSTVTGSNLITNPSGASGTTGWTTGGNIQSLGDAPGGTITATTYQGQPALHWTNDAMDQQSFAQYYPDITDGDSYTFSAEVAGSGQVYMDVYNGGDQETLPVRLTSHYRKFTWTETIPSNGVTGQTGNAPHLEIREVGASPVSVYIKDASVAQSTAAC
jgi:hypothetical protein